jgi:hypothetical protein
MQVVLCLARSILQRHAHVNIKSCAQLVQESNVPPRNSFSQLLEDLIASGIPPSSESRKTFHCLPISSLQDTDRGPAAMNRTACCAVTH